MQGRIDRRTDLRAGVVGRLRVDDHELSLTRATFVSMRIEAK
jgi:hypothetical protein